MVMKSLKLPFYQVNLISSIIIHEPFMKDLKLELEYGKIEESDSEA